MLRDAVEERGLEGGPSDPRRPGCIGTEDGFMAKNSRRRTRSGPWSYTRRSVRPYARYARRNSTSTASSSRPCAASRSDPARSASCGTTPKAGPADPAAASTTPSTFCSLTGSSGDLTSSSGWRGRRVNRPRGYAETKRDVAADLTLLPYHASRDEAWRD